MATAKSATATPPAGYPQGERKLSSSTITGGDNKMKTVAAVDEINCNEGAEDKERAVFFGGYCKPGVDMCRPRPFLKPSPGPVPAPYNKLGYGWYDYNPAPVPAPAPRLYRPPQNDYDDSYTYDDYAANDNHRPMMTNMPRRPPNAERVQRLQDHRIEYGYACNNSDYHCLYRADADDDNNNNANAFAETVVVDDFDPEAGNEYYHYGMDNSSCVYQQQHRFRRQGQLQFQPQPQPQPHKMIPPRNINMEKERNNMMRKPWIMRQPHPAFPPPHDPFFPSDDIPTL